jgi:threonine dehydratase
MKLPDASDVRAAAARMPTEVQGTPCVEAPWLSSGRGHTVWLKVECLQPTHSFKVRGAVNAVAAIVEQQASPAIVTASAGNHGAALAWACRRHRVPLVVFTPRGAPEAKLAAIAESGADLRAVAADYDEAERLALAWARECGSRYVSPYNDPHVIAGAGTVGLEIAEQIPDANEVVVPLGGGGLVSGIAVALRGARHRCRLIGVEAEASPAFTTALASGRITPVSVGASIADGLVGNLEPGSITFDLVKELVDEVRRVGERAIRRAIVELLQFQRLVSEGAGAIGVAAMLDARARADRHDTHATVIVVSGANVDIEVLRALI